MRDEAEGHLRALAGPDARLRDDQWRAIEALVVDRRRALVVQRTGWGKSAVYFVATALLRARGAGATVIVSPLLALMRNQVDAAARAGIRAATINSANVEEWDEVREQVAAGAVDVLLVSPERLNNPSFRDTVLPRLAAETGLLVVDEAHCISDWGHDFRPDYRRIRTLLADLPAGIPVLATTATANQRVVDDVVEQLALGGAEPFVLRGSLERASLSLGVVRLPSNAHRLGWLAAHLGELAGSGIVYALTVAQAEEVAGFLAAQGFAVRSYTGKTEPAERLDAERALLANEVKALVATSALGMGFDKPDLGFVLHLGAPSSPVAYYQQIGRAGRGVDRADVLLLPGEEDEAVWSYFASVGFPPEGLVRQTLTALTDEPMSLPALETQVELGRSRLEQMLKVLDVDGAVRRVQGGWVATGEPWVYDADRYARVAAVRAAEQQAMRDYIAGGVCRMRFLREQLDDPGAADCGRCDVCTGRSWTAAVPDAMLASSRTSLARAGVEVDPRSMWPTGLDRVGAPLKGRIAEKVDPGRAIGRLSDIGWGPRLRTVLAAAHAGVPNVGVPDGGVPDGGVPDGGVPDGGVPDGGVPDDVVQAAVSVLRDWEWAERPTAVCSVGTSALARALGERLATIGRMTWLGEVEKASVQRAVSRTNSAQRVRALHDAFTAPPDVGGQVVLLVDDRTDTGWTFTLAGRSLLQAGARRVLPFALAVDA